MLLYDDRSIKSCTRPPEAPSTCTTDTGGTSHSVETADRDTLFASAYAVQTDNLRIISSAATCQSRLAEPLHKKPADFVRGVEGREHHTCTASDTSASRMLPVVKQDRILHRNDITDPRIIPFHYVTLPITSAGQAPVLSERSKRLLNCIKHQPGLWDRCWCIFHACIPWGLDTAFTRTCDCFLLYFPLSETTNNHQSRATIGPNQNSLHHYRGWENTDT